jgi:Zn-dependent M28 family amino/carboxypeptidase
LQREKVDGANDMVASLTIAFTFDEPCSLRNVVGIVPGSDPELAPERIVVGAHYDHLGRRGDVYYPGADDNASGVVALIAVARAVVADPPARSVVFVFFDGEEKGLLGSKWLVEHPPGEGDVVAMINLDGVGRKPSGHIPEGSPLKIDDSELTVFYSSQSPWIEDELSRVAEVQSLDVTFDPRPVFHEFSDHASFHGKGIPTMFCFSGAHGDYNAPTDTPDKIEWDLLNRRADFVAGCVETLGNRAEALSFYGGAGEKRP